MTIISLWERIRNNKPTLLLFLFGVGFFIRLIFIALYPGVNYYAGSSLRYMNIAQNALSGHGLSVYVDTSRISSLTRQFVYQPFVDKPAGYIIFLWSIFGVFGVAPVVVQIIQALLMALIGPLFYLTAESLTRNQRYALISGLLGAVWLNTARFDVVILPEPLVALPVAIVIWLIARTIGRRKATTIEAIIGGIAIGVGILLRPDVSLWPVFLAIALWLLWGFGRMVRFIVPMMVAVLIVVSFQAVFNFQATGKIIPLGYSNGIAAFEGISQFGDTLGTVYSDDRLKILEDQSDLYYPRGPERDMARTSKAIAIIKERPIWYLKTVLKRIPILLTPRGLFVIGNDTPTQSSKDDFSQKFPGSLLAELKSDPIAAIEKIGSALLGVAAMLLAAIGCWEHRAEWRVWVLPFSVVIYFFFSHIPLNVEPRYFYPAVPFILPLAGTFFVKRLLGQMK